MRKNAIKTFIVHFLIACGYFLLTEIISQNPQFENPIGTGLRRWFFIILHIVVTLLVLAFKKKYTTKTIVLNLLSIISAVFILLVIFELSPNYI